MSRAPGNAPGAPRPPLRLELVWAGDHRFDATAESHALVVDGDGLAGPSPMRMVALGISGCMATDVVSILRKGRHPLTSLHLTFSGERLERPPRRFTAVTLHFELAGDVPDAAVARAIRLSRDKYCSAWTSMRDDIELHTSFTVKRE